jgi:hypothetical protein
MIPLIYIAGPFTAPTPWGIAENVREAERWGLLVAEHGGMPVIPHANTHLFHGQLDAEFWYEGTMALMRACDGVFLMPRWRESRGALAEAQKATLCGIPVCAHYLAGDPPRPSDALKGWIMSIADAKKAAR